MIIHTQSQNKVSESENMQNFIAIDSREKLDKKQHILDYFYNNNIRYQRTKLDVGDYTLYHNRRVCIDLKLGIIELAYNLYNKQENERFIRECVLARQLGILLIVLIEEVPPSNDLTQWQSPRFESGEKIGKRYTNATGGWLKKTMEDFTAKYGVYFKFCEKAQSPEIIVKILDHYNEIWWLEEEKRRKQSENI